MFRRGKPTAQSAADADRKALFEKLALRPENVCPFLALATSRADYEEQATDEHRCYAFGDPEPISLEYQRTVCLQRGYANCPRYLRGVLVIPSDELEALRRPQQRVPPPPPPPPPRPRPMPAPASGSGRRRGVLVALLVLLLLVGGGAGAWWMLAGQDGVARETPSPVPSQTVEPSPSEARPSPSVAPTVAPTPPPGAVLIGYEVVVEEGDNTVFRVSDAGQILAQSVQTFSGPSEGPVDRAEASNGLLHWRETAGPLTGWSFIRDRSGEFQIRAVYEAPDGSLSWLLLPEDET
jgi:hypothetical protein